MRLAYLTAVYPKVSHTFIRRELLELERRGHTVLRLAIRRPDQGIVDPADIEEYKKTTHCLVQPGSALAIAVVKTIASRPRLFFAALRGTLRMGIKSRMGTLRHLAYLAEACFFLPLLSRERIEHVHVHFGTNPAAVAYLINLLGGPSYSMTIHGPTELDDPLGFGIGTKIEHSLFTVAISDYTAAQLRRWVDYRHWQKIRVVRCVVDDRFFEEQQPIGSEPRVLTCVGRLTAQKGQLLLIDAFADALEQGIEATLVLAGDGEMRKAVEHRIRERGITSKVRITGWIDERAVRQHLRESSCLILPSFAEGLPVVIMEAMAMARPVLSTYIAGIPELVRPGENGWLIPAGNSEALRAALMEVCLASPEQLNRLGLAGRERVRHQHDAASESAKLEALIQEHIHPRLP